MKHKKIIFLVFLVFLIGFFLRYFKIGQNLLFSAEHGRDYLAIKSAVLSRQLPLLGPPGSHQFYQGPLYYWLMAPLMSLFSFHPIVGAYVGIMAGSLIVFLNYWVIEKVFNQKVALFSSLAVAVSPLWIEFSREARYYFLVIVPFYFLFWALFRVWQGKERFLFWAGLAFGAMFNFHLSPIYFAPIILVILWKKRKNITRKSIFLGILGFIVANLPLLIHDLTHGMVMTTRFLVWVPYRVVGFLGLYPKNNLTPEVFKENLIAFFNFFSQSFIIGQKGLGILFIAAIVGFIVLNFKKAFVIRRKQDFGWFFIFWTLSLGLLALFIHGSPPKHYFVPILPIPILVFSLFLEKLWKGYLKRALIFAFFLALVFLNLRFFLVSPSFYGPLKGNLLSFRLQEKIVKTIVKNAKGEKFNLKRVGEFDYYPGEHAQNYRYIAWWMGNEPTEEKVKLRYTIYEDLTRLPEEIEEKGKVWEIDKVLVLKEEAE